MNGVFKHSILGRSTLGHGGGGSPPTTAKVYGVSWDRSSNPTLTRTGDSVGMVANIGIGAQAVENDFDSAEIFGEMSRVTDGLGNVFVRIPKFYIKKTKSENLRTWEVSKSPITGSYLPKCFWDFSNEEELPYVLVGAYNAGLEDGKLTSKSAVRPLVNTNIVDFHSYAQGNGAGYQQLDVHTYDVIHTLLFIEFSTLDLQSIHPGYTGARYDAADVATETESSVNHITVANATAAEFSVGQAIGIGAANGSDSVTGTNNSRIVTAITDVGGGNSEIAFDGDAVNITTGDIVGSRGYPSGFSDSLVASSGAPATGNRAPFAYRGIENPWGNVWQWIDGININDHQAWVCDDAAAYQSNLFTTPYYALDYVNGDTNGYVQEFGFDEDAPFAEFPVAVGGSASTYWADYYYQDTGVRVARVGAGWYRGGTAGPSCWDLRNASGGSGIDVGGRLLERPL